MDHRKEECRALKRELVEDLRAALVRSEIPPGALADKVRRLVELEREIDLDADRRRRAGAHVRYIARREQGLCLSCGKAEPKAGYTRCATCLRRGRARYTPVERSRRYRCSWCVKNGYQGHGHNAVSCPRRRASEEARP
jgi:hypothetical protein